MSRYSTILQGLFFFAVVAAQGLALAHPHDFEGWFIASTHIGLDKDRQYQLYLEGQPRVGDNWQRAATVQSRVALVYSWDKQISSAIGYAWTPNFYDSKYQRDYRDEHRLWQQLLVRHDLFGLQWQHRLRQEQRFIARTDDLSHRSRYQLRGSYGLTEKKDFGLTGFDELMVNLNGVQGGPWGGYDRNRIFFGPYWQVENIRYEVGYLGEHLKRFGSDERWAHALLFSVAVTL
jgi:hypothetical protein